MGVCLGRSAVLARKPVAYLTCNGSPPVDGKPSLMTFNEVTTLFHEAGHGLQHMLTKVPHAPAAGINGVEWDAVELPSQFMENFCYDAATIYGTGMAKHHETGEPLPRELFDKLCEQKTFQAGLGMLRQLYFGSLDMELHAQYDPSGDETPFDVQKRVASRFTVLPPLEEDRFLCAFGHIFAGGYSPATTRTSGPRSSPLTPSPPSRRRASTMRTRCARWASASVTPSSPSAAAATPPTFTATSEAATRRPTRCCATLACFEIVVGSIPSQRRTRTP